MVLVSIVGDFYSSILPIFYEFKDKITEHIIIYDDFKNDTIAAKKIKKGTYRFIERYKLPIKTTLHKIDEDEFGHLTKIIPIIENLINTPKELYINVTDGLTNIAIILSNHFRPKGAQILTYDRYDNEYNILTSNSMQTHKLSQSIPIEDHLLLKNVEIVQKSSIQDAQKFEEDINLFFEKYEADKKLAQKSITDPFFHKTSQGTLYEYYIYNLVKRLNVDDILLGVKVRDYREEGLYLENEFDILIMKNNHLHMIECKFWEYYDLIPLLYKLDSVRETLDEDANIFAITFHPTYNPAHNIPYENIHALGKRSLIKRVYLRGRPIYTLQEFFQDIDKLFNLQTSDIETISNKTKHFQSIKKPLRKQKIKEIRDFLQDRLKFSYDPFNIEEIKILLNYKVDKRINAKTTNILQKNTELLKFIKDINKWLNLVSNHTSKNNTSSLITLDDLYTTYKKLSLH